MVRRILSTADRQGAEEETHGKAHLRASARPDLMKSLDEELAPTLGRVVTHTINTLLLPLV